MADNVLAVTDKTFEKEVMESTVPVLVDFWAPWCGPCRMISPIIDNLAESETFKEKVKFVKLNTDENPLTSEKFSITGIPTLLVVKGGEVVDQMVGAAPKPMLERMLSEHI